MLEHWLIELVGHVSGLSEAQLKQIEKSLPATKALVDLLNRARPIIEQAQSLYIDRSSEEYDGIEQIAADAHDERAVEAAVAGVDGVVNAISLYVEHGSDTFHSVHVEAAGKIARAARQAGITRLVHISGIGANMASPSPYIRSRGEGEAALRTALPGGAVIVRPAVMFAADDAFLTAILRLLRSLPAYPIFGDGRTRLQPVYADDVAAAIA